MKRFRTLATLATLLSSLLCGGRCALAEADQQVSLRESARNANYTIEVRLEVESKQLIGRQVITWRNIQPTPTDELWFHLYWNAWRNNRSTWMLEDRLRRRNDRQDEIAEEDWGWIEVDAVRLLPELAGPAVDLGQRRRFEAPDDGNPDDRTVMVVYLPSAVEPGETIRVELEWRAKIPRTFARTGFRGDYYFIAHWFPKLGVYESAGWSCHQYHASTEYFSDYGVYDVSITVPGQFVLGATGRQTDRRQNPDGTVTYRHLQEDVHAFSWTASPDYIEVKDRFEGAGLPAVDLRLLMQPEHLKQSERHLDATRVALDRYGRWYGPYPYGHLTVVDPAWESGVGGMEYPTLFTCGTRRFNPFGGGSPEGVTVHEAGHQFWYGLVGNDEFEDAWLDEGLNTFSTNRAMYDAYGVDRYVRRFFSPPGTDLRGFFPLMLDGFRYGRSIHDERMERFRPYATIDLQSTPSYLYYPAAGSALSYSKTALWLGTLERLLGWERLQPAMAAFFNRFQYRHPRPEDFFAVLEEVTGEDLDWYFDQVYRSAESFDYAVDSVASFPAAIEGFGTEHGELVYRPPAAASDRGEPPEAGILYRSEVVVRRYGGGIFPLQVLLAFDDGEELRFAWDGKDRWRLFVVERPAKLLYAVVDPDDVLLLDIKHTNNSRLLESEARVPALKWTLRWLVWLQDFLTMLTYFG